MTRLMVRAAAAKKKPAKKASRPRTAAKRTGKTASAKKTTSAFEIEG
jgi:hypothetical protein